MLLNFRPIHRYSPESQIEGEDEGDGEHWWRGVESSLTRDSLEPI